MKKSLQNYLKKHNIHYTEYKHPPFFTVKESRKLKQKIPGLHTKCLFLKGLSNSSEHSKVFYLIALPANKRLDTKSLRKKLKLKKLFFASPQELKKELNLTPGSVSIFALINSKKTTLLMDKKIWYAKSSGFHPNINTSTLVLSKESLEKYYKSLKIEKEVIQLG
jgi:Ala-tRNA(Pro) deacylase